MTIYIYKNGAVIRQSKNLRGIREYGVPCKIELSPLEKRPNGVLQVTYTDGATARIDFASYHIMVDFVRNRRTWRQSEIVFNGPNIGYLTKPGVLNA